MIESSFKLNLISKQAAFCTVYPLWPLCFHHRASFFAELLLTPLCSTFLRNKRCDATVICHTTENKRKIFRSRNCILNKAALSSWKQLQQYVFQNVDEWGNIYKSCKRNIRGYNTGFSRFSHCPTGLIKNFSMWNNLHYKVS